MRLDAPRIAPLSDDELNPKHRDALKEQFGDGPVFNIFRTLARAPDAYRGFMRWGGYVLSEKNALPAREREIVILRTGYNWKSGYEWAQHVRIGKQCGLTDDEIDAIKAGPLNPIWTPLESAMLQATDDLTRDGFIADATWAALDELSDKQKMDLVFTVGQYTQVAMMLNTFGVQLDEDLTLDPDLAGD